MVNSLCWQGNRRNNNRK